MESIQPNKPWIKRFWWILIVPALLVCLFLVKTIPKIIDGIGTRNKISQPNRSIEDIPKSSTPVAPNKEESDDLASIEKILASGTFIPDRTGDLVSTGQLDDNPTFYPVDFVDLSGVNVGSDAKNIYLKFFVSAKLPQLSSDFISFENDQIKAMSISFVINDPKTSLGPDAEIDYGITLQSDGKVKPYSTCSAGATGIIQPEEKRFTNKFEDIAVLGGMGEKYVILVIPFDKTGLTKGQAITVNFSSETKSDKYHHASFDQSDKKDFSISL